MFRVDFTRPPVGRESRVVEVKATRGGTAEGFLVWIRIALSGEVAIQSKPGARSVMRTPVLHVFPQPIPPYARVRSSV